MRFRSSYFFAFIIALGVVVWMISDDFGTLSGDQKLDVEAQETESNVDNNVNSAQPITVSAVRVANKTTPLKIRASGVTRMLYEINVISRRKGVVEKILIEEGSWVESGDTVLVLDKGTLNSDIAAARADKAAALAVYEDAKKRYAKDGELAVQIRSAKADLEANRKNYEISQSLVKQGVQTELALSQKRALFRASETRLFELQSISKELELSNSFARLKTIDSQIFRLEEQLKFTEIKSPQKGWLEDVHVESGEFVDENRPVARILGLQFVILDMPIPQTNIEKIRVGDMVEINFAGLGNKEGKVHKISTVANQSTRTFNVEVKLDNSDGKLRSGMSAEASIIVDSVEAFKISPAHLNVDDNGQLTVKIVNSNERVEIVPVQLVRTSGNFAYISGVEENSFLLTTGQAFLSKGELVTYALSKGQN